MVTPVYAPGNVCVEHTSAEGKVVRYSWNPYAAGTSPTHKALLEKKAENARKETETHRLQEEATKNAERQARIATETQERDPAILAVSVARHSQPPRPSFWPSVKEQRAEAEAPRLPEVAGIAAEQEQIPRQTFRQFVKGLAEQDTLTPQALAFHHQQVGWKFFKTGILYFAKTRDQSLQDKQVVAYRYLAQESLKIGKFEDFFYCTIGIANILSNKTDNAGSFTLLESLFDPIPGMSPEVQQTVEAQHLVSAFLGMLKNFSYFTGEEKRRFQKSSKTCFERAKPYFILEKLNKHQCRDLIHSGFGKALGLAD